MEIVTMEVTMYDWEAYALVSFCRRSMFEHFLACSNGGADKDEAYAMLAAISAIRNALAVMGIC